MRSTNPKRTNEDSSKYSILISLYYYELNTHKERINQLEKYLNNHKFESNNYDTFENIYPFILLKYMMKMVKYYINQKNNTNNEACIVKINNHRYDALKPNKNKYIQLKELLKLFTHKELLEFILNKVSY